MLFGMSLTFHRLVATGIRDEANTDAAARRCGQCPNELVVQKLRDYVNSPYAIASASSSEDRCIFLESDEERTDASAAISREVRDRKLGNGRS
jgi:hypothetical protein